MASAASWQNAIELTAQLQPELDLLEKKRRGHLAFLAVAIPLSCALILPPVYFFMLSYAGFSFLTAMAIAAVAGLFIGLGSYRAFDHDYRRKAKRIFLYKIADALRMKYHPQGLYPAGQVYDHYILPPYNTDRTEDGFVFTLAGRRVELQEVSLLKTYGENKAPPPRILQGNERGIIIRLESRKRQPFHTVVVPRGFYYYAAFRGMHHYEKTPFGNPSFSRRYKVLSEDHTDAHDIFGHAFIETFLRFEKVSGSKSLAVSFKKGEIVFYAKNGRDLFEPGHLLSPVKTDSIRKVFEELDVLNDLIDVLKLNPYVGL